VINNFNTHTETPPIEHNSNNPLMQ